MRHSTPYSHLYLVIVSCFFLGSPELLAADSQAKAPSITRITTVSVKSLKFYPSRNAPAQTQSLNQSKIPAQIGALVNRVLVRVGDKVTKGQQLAALDCVEVTLNVAAQQARQQQLTSSLH